MSLTLTNIPKIMNARGWTKGALLMQRWFNGSAVTAPTYTSPDTSTITMEWVLRFARAKSVYDQLVADQIWANAAAQKEIARMLRKKGLLVSGAAQTFGDLSNPTPSQHSDYVNFRAFTDGGYYGSYYGGYYGYSSNVMDDLTAALGRFVFHVVVAGDVQPNSSSKGASGFQVTIREVGIYVRDTYDFNGSQHLGFWDDSDNSVSPTNFLSGTRVSNESFRDWRAANRRGGDFLIFSDVKTIRLAKPFTFVAT
jgi:Family of unknown function (DUF6402)